MMPKETETSWVEDTVRDLDGAGLRFVVAGGVAVNLHGVPRFTKDLDLLISWDAGNARSVISYFVSTGYALHQPVDPMLFVDENFRRKAADEKGLRAMTFYCVAAPYRVVDLLLLDIDADAIIARGLRCKSSTGVSIPVVSLRDLRDMKLAASRPQDLDDVAALDVAVDVETRRRPGSSR